MKKKLIILFCFVCFNSFAYEKADYHILSGSLHKGGIAHIDIIEKDKNKFVAKMNYQINKRMLVPVPKKALSGEMTIALPPEFSTDKGYLKLEKLGKIEIDSALIKFVSRMSWHGKKDAFHVLIIPKNGKSKIDILYHPSIPAAGWGRIIITFISPYPILNGYYAIVDIN